MNLKTTLLAIGFGLTLHGSVERLLAVVGSEGTRMELQNR